MSYVDPSTLHDPSPLGVVPAGWGDQIRDNFEWLVRHKPRCRLFNPLSVAMASGVWTTIDFASERFDIPNLHRELPATAWSKITIPVGGDGLYALGGHFHFNVAGGGTARAIRIRLNGTTVLATGPGAPISASVRAYCHVATMYELSAGDYVELQGYQDSGGGISTVASANESPEFWASWLARLAA